MMRIMCSRCCATFLEDQLIVEDEVERCPVCKLSGGLQDMYDPYDYDETAPRQQRLHMALMAAYELSDSLEIALGHPGDQKAMSDAETALKDVTGWMDAVRKEESQ